MIAFTPDARDGGRPESERRGEWGREEALSKLSCFETDYGEISKYSTFIRYTAEGKQPFHKHNVTHKNNYYGG